MPVTLAHPPLEASGVVQQVVEAIVREVDPLRIILFGSHARGDAGPESDYDFLVVIPDDQKPLATMMRLAQRVRVPHVPIDFLAVREADLARHAENPGLIYPEILKTGRELYAA